MLNNYNPNDREIITLHCVIDLLQPLSHIGEVTGNVSNLKTVKLLDIEGVSRACFVYSGNALRNGILRRVGISHVLDQTGLTVNPNVHHTLFAGGRIDGSTANDMELDNKIRRLMPWLSVLGTAKPVGVFGSKNAQMIQGRINVGSAYLVCYESARLVASQIPGILPRDIIKAIKHLQEFECSQSPFEPMDMDRAAQWQSIKEEIIPILKKKLKTWTEFLTIDQTIRRDSTEDPSLVKFLADDNTLSIQGDLFNQIEKPKASSTKSNVSHKMIASDRLIAAGSKLYSRWDINATKVEIGWVIDTLLQFAKFPYLGGKGNRGNGLCKLDFWYQQGENKGHFLSVSTENQVLSDTAKASHAAYREYLEAWKQYIESANKQEMRNFLNAAA